MKKGVWISSLLLKGRRPFIDHPRVPQLEHSYFTTRVKLHDGWDPRLKILAMELVVGCPTVFWTLGIDVASTWGSLWCGHRPASLHLVAKLPHVGADVDRLACHLH
jgi:hypothetical protein